MTCLNDYNGNYENSQEHNDYLFGHFTNETNHIPYVKKHKDYIERHNLGFDERAFGYMWYLIINHVKDNHVNPDLLEIGVFKGQICLLKTF
jgi:hypothetical protein